jgi:hypothetical protein
MNFEEQEGWAINRFKKIALDMKKCVASNYSKECIKAVKSHIIAVGVSSGFQPVGATLEPTEFVLVVEEAEIFAVKPTAGVRIEGLCSRGVFDDPPVLILSPLIEDPENEYGFSHEIGDAVTIKLSESEEFTLSQIAELFGFDELIVHDIGADIKTNRPSKANNERKNNQEPDWPWPMLDVTEGKGKSHFAAKFADVSALKLLGYSVGKNGLNVAERKEFLKRFLTKPLPSIVSELFGDTWANPGSEERLRKMADTISSNCKNFKRNDATRYRVAIEDWEFDLAWLKNSFYKRGRFPWPDTFAD